MLNVLQERIPDKRNIVTVFAVAMFLSYTWTLFTSFWKLPSWLFFLEIGEILSIYSYAFLVNFLESLILVSLVLLAGIVLPRQWWRDTFIPKGFVLILVILGSAVLHVSLYRTPDTRGLFVHGQVAWWVATCVIGLLLTWIAGRVTWMHQGLESMAERFLIFLYVYVPLTVLALLVIIVRVVL